MYKGERTNRFYYLEKKTRNEFAWGHNSMSYSLEPSSYFRLYKSFEPPSSTLRGRWTYALGDFFGQNSMPNNLLFEGFSAATRIFISDGCVFLAEL